MSLPHLSEEKLLDSPYFLRRLHHKRDKDGYLFISRHIRVLFAFFVTRKLQASELRQGISTICSARRMVVCTRTTSGAYFRNALNSNKLRRERTAEFQSLKTPSCSL
jgi:hypothetical protein